jgi:hypothetical protein
MPIYTVHEPPRRDDELLAHTARFRFVRDGFHFWALLLALIAYLLLIGGMTFALRRLGIEESAGGLVWFLTSLLVGIEASSLLRWKLARRGYENLGVVVAEDQDIAERRFFDGWVSENGRLATPSAAPPPAGPSPFERPASSEIVGLFPQPEPRP